MFGGVRLPSNSMLALYFSSLRLLTVQILVIAELALNLPAVWRCPDLLKAKHSHQLAFSRREYSL